MKVTEKKELYDMEITSCPSFVIPNYEIKESYEEGFNIANAIGRAFKVIEKDDFVVKKVLISPEMHKILQKSMSKDCFDKKLWTADVQIIKNLKEIIFLGNQCFVTI